MDPTSDTKCDDLDLDSDDLELLYLNIAKFLMGEYIPEELNFFSVALILNVSKRKPDRFICKNISIFFLVNKCINSYTSSPWPDVRSIILIRTPVTCGSYPWQQSNYMKLGHCDLLYLL